MSKLIFSSFFIFSSCAVAADNCVTLSKIVQCGRQNSGKELVVINGKIFELNVKKTFTSDADELVVTYTKFNEDNSIFIDSVIYSDGTTSILETDFFSAEGISIYREKSRNGIDSYEIRKGQKIIERYDIGLKKDELYDSDGNLNPEYREVRGDTAFRDLNYIAPYSGYGFQIIEVNDKEREKIVTKDKK